MSETRRLDEFVRGWVIGAFSPAILETTAFEVAVKYFSQDSEEAQHYQRVSTEYTIVVHGRCLIGATECGPGDIMILHPGEVAGFQGLSDGALIAIKVPSIPNDKVVV